MPSDDPITADTITAEQIRELMASPGLVLRNTCLAALDSGGGYTAEMRAWARARCAEIWNERTAAMSRQKDEVAMSDDINARVIKAEQAAQEAFWRVVAEHFPEAETGDLDYATAKLFGDASAEAVRAWWEANRPTTATQIATCEIRVLMRPPRAGERCWWVAARTPEAALTEILRESEEIGFVTQVDHDGEPDREGMIPVTIEIGRAP